ncbi:TonB-dependent receptor [Chitinophaga sp. MM2321]|uniref:TonB-dependent receptor n=1 Tax=Chitinophaga sp. MM2321 TaxID=3137178 RepID=UPI0032D5B0AA
MKLSAIFLLVGCLQLSAAAYSQEKYFTLSFDQVPLEKVFASVKQQGDYLFLYNNENINKAGARVSVNLEAATIKQVMDACMKGLPLSYRIIDKTVIITPGEVAPAEVVQDIRISGTVKDSTGKPLIGVSVGVEGTSKGTVTNENGHFALDGVKQDAFLVFSYVGFTSQRISVGGRSGIEIILKENNTGLNEVVVLGFGQTQKKIAQTGAIASLSTKELMQSPVANITNALAGRMPGLISIQRSGEPGADASTLFLRGRATLNSTAPLVTIDGIQKEYNAISLLDANEIETISILKDASATALYGVKGANGVIIITTRRGKLGKPRMNARVQRAVQTAIRLPKFADSYGFATLRNEAYLNDNPGGSSLPFSEEALEAYRTHADPYRYPDVDWVKEMMKSSNLTQANFDISGGTTLVKYFVNVGYTDQDGLFRLEKMPNYDPNIKYKRYNFRSNIDIEFDKDFSLSMNLFGAIENKNGPRRSTGELFSALMWVPPLATPIKYPTGVYGYSSTYGGGNPIGDVQQAGYKEAFNSSLSGKISATRKMDFITKGLSVKGNFSFDGYFRNNVERGRTGYFAFYEGGDLMDPLSYRYQNTKDAPLGPPWSTTDQSRDTWLDFSLNYERLYGKKGEHNVTGFLLANRQQRVISGQIPFVSQGLVGRLAYGFRNKYFAEFNAGLNGTDNFSKGNRYGFFPSYSAAWVLSEESFMKGSSVVDFLKLRASYGSVGNDQLPGRRWLFIGEFNPGGGYNFGDPASNTDGVQEGPMPNSLVTWETSKKTNLGLEVRLLGDLLGMTLDVFKEKRSDMLVTRGTIPAMVGVPTGNLPPANMGRTENKGFELELRHQRTVKKDLTYFVNGNLTYARNKILFMDEENRAYDYLYRTGHPIGQIYGLTALGFFNDKAEIAAAPPQFGTVIPGDIRYLDRNNDGVIDQNDQGPIGRSDVPEVFYGISGGVNWKNLDFSFLLQGAGNFNVMFSARGAWEFQNGGKVLESHLNRWTPETAATASYPAIHSGTNANNHNASTFFLKDASYMRLKNMEIGYTFRQLWLKNGRGISSLRIYANGMNLYTWDKIGGDFDPEAPSGEGAIYPQQRVINIGASVGF